MLPLGLMAGCAATFDLDKIDDPVPPPIDPCGSTAAVPDTITLLGTLLDATNDAPLVGLSVDAMPGGVAPTDAVGRFTIDIPTQSEPLYTQLTASGLAGYPRTVIAFQRPFTRSPSPVESKLLPDSAIDSLYGAPRSNDVATALLSLRDCDGNGVDNAQLTVEPAATVVYQGGLDVTNGTGVGYALSLAPGTITVTPTGGNAFSFDLAAGDMAIVYLVAP